MWKILLSTSRRLDRQSSGGNVLLSSNSMPGIKRAQYGSLHSEIAVFYKWLHLNYQYRRINMVVIRVNNNGDLLMSKPCNNCINRLQKLCKQYNIHINYIYYSDSTGNITREKFYRLINNDSKHISRRGRQHGW